jgi:PIN domain nuclease of toxin-antitoxin system
VRGALADTHTILWWLADDSRLSDTARDLIETGMVAVYFSAASVWEIGIKSAAGRLVIADDYLEAMKQDGFVELGISARHARLAGGLPPLHRDPFDRVLVAQAQDEDLAVVTRDSRIASYGVAVRW